MENSYGMNEDEGEESVSSKMWFATQPVGLALSRYLHQEHFADVIFRVPSHVVHEEQQPQEAQKTSSEGEFEMREYFGHKAVLYARSIHFRHLFEAKIALQQQLQQVLMRITWFSFSTIFRRLFAFSKILVIG